MQKFGEKSSKFARARPDDGLCAFVLAGAHRHSRRPSAAGIFEPVDRLPSNFLRLLRASAHAIEPHDKIWSETH